MLTNPGFEVGASPLLWNVYGLNGPNVSTQTSASVAHSGTNYLKVYPQFVGSVNYSGVYQDNLSGTGAAYAADGWAFTLSSDVLAGQNQAWIEVTFRDALGNVLALYRSQIINTNLIASGAFPKSAWIDLPITNQYDPGTYVITNTVSTLIAPTGTSFVRYQIVFEGDANYSNGSVYFDDLTLALVGGGPQGNWNITWSDEFNGTSIASSNWTYDTGGGGWGNNEQEDYTTSAQNSYVSNGLLHIVALQQSAGGENYTSARMKSIGLFTTLYGRIAFRAKIPAGDGLWPALWMMPESSVYGGWAASGEIDVMETVGSNPTNVFGTLHFGGPYPDQAQSYGPSYNFLPGTSVTNFNVYTLEWTTNAINWYINGLLYEDQTNWWSSSNTSNTETNAYPAPFNQPFYIIMNVAVGGTLGGTISNSSFPADMQVDYVRLYKLTQPLQLSAAFSNGLVTLTWPTNVVCHLEGAGKLSSNPNWITVPTTGGAYTVSPVYPSFYRLVSP